jgi:hypothetical protein
MENIANDESFVGTVLLSFAAYNLTIEKTFDEANTWVERYAEELRNSHEDPYYFRIENRLERQLESRFSFTQFGGNPLGQFVFSGMSRYTYMDGERRIYADFTQVDTDALHFLRMKDYIGIPPVVKSHEPWHERILPNLLTAIEKIQGRGGNVIALRFPSDEEIFAGEQVKFPPDQYWEKFEALTTAQTLHFSDYPEFSMFKLPDGIHIDRRDSTAFTKLLSEIIFGAEQFDSELIRSCRTIAD